jgi:2-polyprenyl-3-methyl-5-hydroxy-6-metoxy-1,4-benzoquinol methylase
MKIKNCNNCGKPFSEIIDLGKHPCADTFVKSKEIAKNLPKYSLAVGYCECHHFSAINKIKPDERYSKYDYSYTSDNSPVSRKHFKEIANRIIKKFKFNKQKSIIEIGSNDGTFLKNFLKKGYGSVLGVDPSKFMCNLAEEKNVHSYRSYFSFKTSKKIKKNFGLFDICYAANVFNHVDDIHDFLRGVDNVLKKNGNVIIEVPDLNSLLKNCGFDTIYHEHRQYFSKNSLLRCFEQKNFYLINIEKIKYMSGSIRIFATKKKPSITKNLKELSKKEIIYNLVQVKNFKKKIIFIKKEMNSFVKKLNFKNKIIVGLGAATKGNTLLNFCNFNEKKIKYILESSPHKIGKFTPGSSIPIIDENKILKFDAAIILPWNITEHLFKKFLQKKNIPYINIPNLIKKFKD